MQDNIKKHYYIICGQVAWRRDEKTDALQIVPANTIAAFSDPFIRQFDLARINMALVENAGTMVGEAINPQLVAGVTLMSVNSLGYMSEEQFRAQPNTHAVAEDVRNSLAEAADAAAGDQAERA